MESPLQAWGQIHSLTHCFYVPASCQGRKGAEVMHAMKMSMVNLSDVKQHVPISLLGGESSLTYVKPCDLWQAFLRCILLTIALYLSADEHGKQIYTAILHTM